MAHPLAKRLAVNEFGCDETRLADGPDLIDRNNVGMVEGGCGLRLLDKALKPLFITRDIRRQDLYRDSAVKLGISREIYVAHAAFSDL